MKDAVDLASFTSSRTVARAFRPYRAIGAALSLGALCVLFLPQSASATPAFARKYETSCQTCHVAFPALNPFGEAYRRNAYRFPAGDEEGTSTDEAVPLGHEVHRRLFPDQVWPGEVPGSLPIAATLAMQATMLDADGHESLDFHSLGASGGLTVSGSMDDTFSGWLGVSILGDPNGEFTAQLERAFLTVMVFEEPSLLVRLGRIETSLMGFTSHRTLGPPPLILTQPIGDSFFTVDPAQHGLEVSGVLGAGRLGYSLGVFEPPTTALESVDDVYGRLSYKLGGMRLDGVGGTDADRPWRDESLQLGIFGMAGRNVIGDPEVGTQDDRYHLIGASFEAIVWDFTFTAAYAHGENDHPIFAEPFREVTSQQVFTQLNWVHFPWLVPSARFELRALDEDPVTGQIVPGIFALVRSNIRAQIYGTIDYSGSHLDLSQILAGVNGAF